MSKTVYLDCNATAPLRLEAEQAVVRALKAGGNPSSVHALGRAARRTVEDAREQVRGLVHAPKNARVIFTSGGTEANVLTLLGCGRDKLFAPRTEHPSVLMTQDRFKAGMTTIRVDANGLIDPFELEELFAGGGDDVLVSVMLANNETGVLQQVEGIVRMAHRYDALVHTDPVQAAGKIDVDFAAMGCDYLTLASHKLGGPQGVGALIATADAPLLALQAGGGQEGGLRGGTENVSGIAGFGAACAAAKAGRETDMKRIAALRDRLEAQITALAPDARVIAGQADRLPNTSLMVMPGVASDSQLMAFDLAGICVSAGSACASGKTKASGVLMAMGIPAEQAKCAVRVSFGPMNTEEDVESFFSAWKDLYERSGQKRKRSAA